MIISHKYKVVFIHIPKAAGSYIENILKNIDPDSIDIDYYNEDNLYGHIPFYLIKTMNIFEIIKHYTFFSVIRDPISLILSHYNYILTCNDTHYLYKEIKNKSVLESISIILNNNYSLSLMYICNDNNHDVEYLYNNINKQIIFLKYENITYNFKCFLEKIGVPSIDIDINFNTNIINKSNNYIDNIIDDINKLNEDEKRIIEVNKLFYESL